MSRESIFFKDKREKIPFFNLFLFPLVVHFKRINLKFGVIVPF